MRKKRSEMTPKERMEYIMTGSTWEEAEEVGIEILARCSALHVYARKEDEDYILNLSMKVTERICRRADEWAHEGNHPFILACAAAGHRREQEEKLNNINKEKEHGQKD